jgi:putative phosphoesterase
MDTLPVTNLADGGRIGLLADTHCEAGGRRLPAALFDAFAGTALILHLGDCGDAGALDELGRIAPLIATRGFDDNRQDERYADRRVVSAAQLSIGALFDLASAGLAVHDGRISAPSAAGVDSALSAAFGRRVEVVCFAATHAPLVAQLGGVLFVNPGSATLPAEPGRSSAAIVDVRGAVASVELVRL